MNDSCNFVAAFAENDLVETGRRTQLNSAERLIDFKLVAVIKCSSFSLVQNGFDIQKHFLNTIAK